MSNKNRSYKKYIFLEYGLTSNYDEKLDLIKKCGFDGVFLEYRDNLEEIVNIVRNHNVEIETVHLPFNKTNELWVDCQEGEDFKNLLIEGIKKAGKLNIKTVIVHTARGKNPPEISSIGLNRFKEMVKVCEENNVTMAIENIQRLDYLDYIFDNIKSNNLKYCFDCGHANCYTNNIEVYPFDKYKDKMICTHLHDNDGKGDLHTFIFTGTINWEKLMHKFKEINYQGPLTLEVLTNNMHIDNEEKFVKDLKEQLDKLEQMIC